MTKDQLLANITLIEVLMFAWPFAVFGIVFVYLFVVEPRISTWLENRSRAKWRKIHE